MSPWVCIAPVYLILREDTEIAPGTGRLARIGFGLGVGQSGTRITRNPLNGQSESHHGLLGIWGSVMFQDESW